MNYKYVVKTSFRLLPNYILCDIITIRDALRRGGSDMSKKEGNEFSFFTYKGYPLVRNKDVLYYGNMYDDYVIMLQIIETKKVKGLDVASKVKVYQMSTDESLNPLEAITRTAEKDGLYEALDLAEVWLKRSMAKVKSKA